MARAALNTQTQQFMTESFVKERDQRLAWYLRNKGMSSAPAHGSRQTEVFKKQIESCPKTDLLERLPKNYRAPTYHRKKTNFDDALLKLIKPRREGEDDPALSSDMAKATKSQTVVLMDGFSKEGKGRYAYLKRRIQIKPEEKFIHPTCSSWDYGWRLSDYIKKEEIKKPVYGRTRIVSDTFYTRNGIPAYPQ